MLQVCKQSLIGGANIRIIFENTILLLNYFNRFFLFPVLRLLIHNPTMILIETFMVYIKKFCYLIVLYLDLNKFPNQPSKSRPITTADIILIIISSNFRGHITSQGLLGKIIYFSKIIGRSRRTFTTCSSRPNFVLLKIVF